MSGSRLLPESGPLAPPRANGELVFREAWESRAFAIAVSLHEQGRFAWGEFQRALSEEIAGFERAHPEARTEAAGYRYYERWLAALERVVTEKGLCAGAELDGRAVSFAERPQGHDH